jgi:hypothetical protein
MKRILALTFCLGLGLATVAHADDKDKKHAKKAATAAAVGQRNAVRAARQNANYQRSVQHSARIQQKTFAHQNQNALRIQNQRAKIQQNNASVNARNWKRQTHNAAVANQSNRVINQNTRAINRNNRAIVRNNVAVRNRNSWAEARRFNWHHRHDRSWWRNHYGNTRFVIFGGGYYFWNNGYWYPAYGYDPAYSTYQYDEPIYGYNQLAPSDVISNVQGQLQQQGYYEGEVDGSLGPMTRDALARFQEDAGLVVTRAIDEPTLEALGLT